MFTFHTSTTELIPSYDALKVIGRSMLDEKGLYISWSNGGFTLRYQASRITFFFADYICDRPVVVKIILDDGSYTKYVLSGKEPMILLENLPQGERTLTLLRVSEDDTPLIFKKAILWGERPKVLKKAPDKKLKIAFLGDSVTSGFGVIARGDNGNFYTYEEDASLTYAMLTAKALDADFRMTSNSGIGIVHACSGKEITFLAMFNRLIRGTEIQMTSPDFIPDVYVINGGANDNSGGTTIEQMYVGANRLIDRIREVFPHTAIVWTYGILNDKFTDILDKVISERIQKGDRKIAFVPTAVRDTETEMGSVGHPNYLSSVKVSKILTAAIKKLLDI